MAIRTTGVVLAVRKAQAAQPEQATRATRVKQAMLPVICAAAGYLLAGVASADAAIPYTAYAGNMTSETLTPIDTEKNAAGSTLAVKSPAAIAITPDGTTAWVVDQTQGTVTPVTLSNGSVGSPITVGSVPAEIAITPDGTEAYVTNESSNTVTPINLATRVAGTPIAVPNTPWAIAITPDGKKAYVTNEGASTVTPITLATGALGTPITVGSQPVAIAITPDGKTAYVANHVSNSVTPINLASGTAGAAITVGSQPMGIAITPDGKSAYVTNEGSASVTPINLTNNTAGTAITVGNQPVAVAITPDQATAYVVNYNASLPSAVVPISLPGNTAGAGVSVGGGPDALAITPDQAPVASFTVTPGLPGAASSFDASASTVAYGTITTYEWHFGDGETETTSAPTTTHVYAKAGEYTATLTETDSAGTSTTQVFTGQTVSRNGGPGAQTIRSFAVTPAPVNISLPTISGAALQGQALAEVHGSWSNEPTGFAYQWLRCDASGSGCVAIANATGQAYTPGAEDVGRELRVKETASNAGGPSNPVESTATAVVAAASLPGAAPATGGHPTPSTTPGAGSPTGGPHVTSSMLAVISTRSLTMTRGGDVWIKLSCPATAAHGCDGTITITLAQPRARRSRAVAARCGRGCRTLGSATYEARAGGKVRIRVHIASLGRRLLAHTRALPVTLTATTFSGGRPLTSARTITLRAPGRLA